MRKKLGAGRYLTLETRKDGTKFTSRPLREAAERLQAISRSYDQRQAALVEQARCGRGMRPPSSCMHRSQWRCRAYAPRQLHAAPTGAAAHAPWQLHAPSSAGPCSWAHVHSPAAAAVCSEQGCRTAPAA